MRGIREQAIISRLETRCMNLCTGGVPWGGLQKWAPAHTHSLAAPQPRLAPHLGLMPPPRLPHHPTCGAIPCLAPSAPLAAAASHCLWSNRWGNQAPTHTRLDLVPPAHLLHHPTMVLLSSGPIGAGSASTDVCC
uniref:Uncharacterized protein n=1 Tax=Myotis myotis TaxID=51298 RepID=A0A7J8ALP9_MYOMY|nr:hypothetical protein mMyoMyo1_007873 [Myotis myotis]